MKNYNNQRIERAFNITPECIKASKFINDKLNKRRNAKDWRKSSLIIKKIIKRQTANGLQNDKEKPFALFDLKTDKILMRKDMTAFKASRLNHQLESMGMHWKNIPY